MVKYEKRLRKLARRAQLCPSHLSRLWCLRCEARLAEPAWTGTNDELAELCALIERAAPYRDQIPAAGRCPVFSCGGRLWCEPCYHAAAAQIVLPDDLYTPAERSRMAALMGHLTYHDLAI